MNYARIQTIIDELKENKDIFSSLEFTKAIYEATHSQQSIVVNVDEVISLYTQLSKEYSEDTQNAEFIKNGLEVQKRKRSQNNASHTSLTAYMAHRITAMLNYVNLTPPHWMPEVYRVDGSEFDTEEHRYIYLFNWDSVDNKMIPNNDLERMLTTLLKIKSNDTIKKDTPHPKINQAVNFVENLEDKIKKDKAGEVLEVTTAVENQPNDIELATCFLEFKKISDTEKKDFSLTLEQLKERMTNKTCHYSGQELKAGSDYTLATLDTFSYVCAESICFISSAIQKVFNALNKEEKQELTSAIDTLRKFGASTEQISGIITTFKK